MASTSVADRATSVLLLNPSLQLRPLDDSHAATVIGDIAASAAESDLPRLAEFLAGDSEARGFLAAVFDLSPFLRDLARQAPHARRTFREDGC